MLGGYARDNFHFERHLSTPEIGVSDEAEEARRFLVFTS